MTSYLRTQGVLSLGSRLRALSDNLFKQGDLVYQAQGVPMYSRWFPIISLVANSAEPITITYIAQQTGFSHPYISTQARKMIKLGYLQDHKDPQDERCRLISLTQEGAELVERATPLWDTFKQVAGHSVQNSGSDFLDAVERFENEIEARPWCEEVAKLLNTEVEIVDYKPEYKQYFADLNIEWLEKYFEVEEIDKDYFRNPEAKILNKGGHILFAKINNKIVGTCALIKEDGDVYELAKMGVASGYQGKGIGAKLIKAAIEHYQKLNGKTLYLETHDLLQAAIRLYAKFGFVDQKHRKPGSEYARSNVYMIWKESCGVKGV